MSLTPHEERLLTALRTKRGQIVERDDLIGALWPNPDREPEGADGALRAHIHNLRRKGVTIESATGYRLPR